MKIYNEVVIDMNTGETIYEDSFDYDGDIALCCDPTGGMQPGDPGYDEYIEDAKAKQKDLEDKKREWGLEALSMDQFYEEIDDMTSTMIAKSVNVVETGGKR